MYRRPKFQEVLLKIRQDMSRDADYDVDLFAEMVRSGNFPSGAGIYDLSENKENTSKRENGKVSNPKSEI